MSQIRITDIQIADNRQRREFDPASLNELRESIEKRGLFHAIVLREEASKHYLVAGERRFRAISDLYDLGGTFFHNGVEVPAGMLPYVTLGQLTELEREEAELEENICRNDLTWQEKAEATSRLAALRGRQAAAKDLPLPTVASIATEVRGSAEGRAREATRRELIVAAHMHKPEVAAAKNVDEAFKVLKKAEEKDKNRKLAESVGRVYTADVHRLHLGDAVEWLKDCPDSFFDVIITDPPYGMAADSFGDSAGAVGGHVANDNGSHGYEDSYEIFEQCVGALAEQSMRITKPQAHLYLFCDFDNFHTAKRWFLAAGWEVHRTPLIWDKVHGSRVPWPEYGPRRNYEVILYAVKGKRPVTSIAPDVISCRSDANLGHGAQKPVALFQELLKRSTRPGDSVIDPFCGTGPVFEAAHSLKCYATGIELDPANYGISVSRIERLRSQKELEL